MMSRRVLSERYELRRVAGRGGMAVVWEAHDRVLGRRVAVKVLHPSLAGDHGFLERFRREATASASLNHPSIVSMYDAGIDGDSNYLVMEYLDGATLADLLADRGRLEVDQVVEVGITLAGALDALHHAGLVHRDVKPANIMIAPSGGVKLMDLGIALGADATSLTATASMIGTAAYISPEQASGQIADARADIYSLGCVLFEAATGRRPFEGDSAVAVAVQHMSASPPVPSALVATLPSKLDTILGRALAKEPDRRYASAEAMANELLQLSTDAASTAIASIPTGSGTAATLVDATAVHPGPVSTTAEEERPLASPGRRRTPSTWLLGRLALLAIAVALALASVAGWFDSVDDVGGDAPPIDTPSPATDTTSSRPPPSPPPPSPPRRRLRPSQVESTPRWPTSGVRPIGPWPTVRSTRALAMAWSTRRSMLSTRPVTATTMHSIRSDRCGRSSRTCATSFTRRRPISSVGPSTCSSERSSRRCSPFGVQRWRHLNAQLTRAFALVRVVSEGGLEPPRP
jgi:serine/threonine protein kinase